MNPDWRHRRTKVRKILDTIRLCNATRYERTEARRDTRAGYYERKLQTRAGEVKLKMLLPPMLYDLKITV